MKSFNEYMSYPTIGKLSINDAKEYELNHIHTGELLKRVEIFETKKDGILNMEKRISTLESRMNTFLQYFEELLKTIEKLENEIAILKNRNIGDIEIKENGTIIQEKKKLELSIGDTYSFGKYNGNNIKWIVLDKNELGDLLIITEDVLLTRKFHFMLDKISWEKSDIREYLNDSFYTSSFSDEEKKRIKKLFHNNQVKRGSDKLGGNDTSDFVFLLSIEEANIYLKHSEKRIAYMNGIQTGYWLRTVGQYETRYSEVDKNGTINEYGLLVNNVNGIRPVMWVKYDG